MEVIYTRDGSVNAENYPEIAEQHVLPSRGHLLGASMHF